MNVDMNLPMELYKANMQLWMSTGLLLQEVRQHWLDLGDKTIGDDVAETQAELDELAKSADWKGLANLPGTAMWRMVQKRMGDLQACTETAVAEQMHFASGLQDALSAWQKATTQAITDAGKSMPLTAPMQNMLPDFTAFMSALTPGANAPAAKPTRRGKSDAH